MATTSTDYTRTIRNPSLKYSSPKSGRRALRIQSLYLALGSRQWLCAYEEAYPSKWLFNTLKKDLTEDGEYSDRLYETIIFDDPKSRPFYYEDGKGFSDYHQEDNIYWRKYVTYDKSLGDYWDYSVSTSPSSAMRTSCCSMPSV